MATAEASISRFDAVLLGHALVAREASRLGIAALLIKGPLAHDLKVRRRRRSADVDVLVRPTDRSTLCEALVEKGWRARPTGGGPRFFALHSETMYHPQWPCDIDVHDSYPGFFADPAHVFDELWSDRREHCVGGVEVWSPSPEASALILALHALRNDRDLRSDNELDDVIEFAKATPGRIEAMQDLAREARATEALEPIWDRLGCAVARDLTERERRAWDLVRRSPEDSSILHWIVAVQDADGVKATCGVLGQLALQLILNRDSEGGPFGTVTRRARIKRSIRAAQRLTAQSGRRLWSGRGD